MNTESCYTINHCTPVCWLSDIYKVSVLGSGPTLYKQNIMFEFESPSDEILNTVWCSLYLRFHIDDF